MILRVLQIVNCVGFAWPDVITCTRAPSSLAPRAHPRVPKVGAHLEPEDLPLIRELLTEDEYAELLRKMVQVVPNGPLLDYRQAFGEPSTN